MGRKAIEIFKIDCNEFLLSHANISLWKKKCDTIWKNKNNTFVT